MKYKSYLYISKLSSLDVSNILKGTCYISHTVNGTNGCIFLKDNDTLGFGSKTRELTRDSDNNGFVNSFQTVKFITDENDTVVTQTSYPTKSLELLAYLRKHPTYIIYGEWLPFKANGVYPLKVSNKFYVFDMYDAEKDTYLSPDIWANELQALCPHTQIVPFIAKLENPTKEDLETILLKTKDFLINGRLIERVIIKNYGFKTKDGKTIWAKVTGAELDSCFNIKLAKEEDDINYQISEMLSNDLVQRELLKVGAVRNELTTEVINQLCTDIFNAFWRENSTLIMSKFNLPVVDFKLQKQLCTRKVKALLNKGED